jgi:transposase
VAKDFGIGKATLHSWLKKYEGGDDRPTKLSSEAAELRESKKRIKLLEQENEVLRRAAVYLGRGVNPK